MPCLRVRVCLQSTPPSRTTCRGTRSFRRRSFWTRESECVWPFLTVSHSLALCSSFSLSAVALFLTPSSHLFSVVLLHASTSFLTPFSLLLSHSPLRTLKSHPLIVKALLLFWATFDKDLDGTIGWLEYSNVHLKMMKGECVCVCACAIVIMSTPRIRCLFCLCAKRVLSHTMCIGAKDLSHTHTTALSPTCGHLHQYTASQTPFTSTLHHRHPHPMMFLR